jgi:hypothetical protein
MFKIILFILFAVFASNSFGHLTIEVPINAENVADFNVQIRHYSHPYNVNSSTFGCLGALISLNKVLTVASCVYHHEVKNIVLIIGSTTFDHNNDNSEVHLVEKIDIHPGFKRNQFLVDNLAVLTVNIVKYSKIFLIKLNFMFSSDQS